METFDFSTVKHLFTTRKKILITSHSNPDGDAVGSALALYHFFKNMDQDVFVMVPNGYPDFLSWMPGQENILKYNESKSECDELMKNSDILFSLDYNAPSRIQDASESFSASNAIKILIDHHIDPEKSAFTYIFSTTQVSSTSELLYQFMVALGNEYIDKAVAENIYVGIMTDTGSFSYNCRFQSTFLIVAKLIGHGIDPNRINRLVYSNNSESRLRLLGFALNEKLVVLPDYHTAYISLTKDELQTHDYKSGDTEGLVNYALGIKDVNFAVLFTERDNSIRISFRSAGNFSVNDFARKHYQGGGHKNAAGGDSFLPMEPTILEFNRLLEDYADILK